MESIRRLINFVRFDDLRESLTRLILIERIGYHDVIRILNFHTHSIPKSHVMLVAFVFLIEILVDFTKFGTQLLFAFWRAIKLSEKVVQLIHMNTRVTDKPRDIPCNFLERCKSIAHGVFAENHDWYDLLTNTSCLNKAVYVCDIQLFASAILEARRIA